MAIINKPKQQKENTEEPVKGIISARNPGNPIEAQDIADSSNVTHQEGNTTESSAKSRKGLVFAFVLLSVIAAGVGLYHSVPPSSEVQKQVELDRERVEVTFERAVRIHSLVQLIDKRIDNSATTLAAAEERNDEVLVDTLRLTLAQNLSDREEHLAKYVSSILELNEMYLSDKEQFTAVVKNYVNEAEQEYKVGRIEAAGEILPILQNAPLDSGIKEHIEKAVGLKQ